MKNISENRMECAPRSSMLFSLREEEARLRVPSCMCVSDNVEVKCVFVKIFHRNSDGSSNLWGNMEHLKYLAYLPVSNH